MESNYVIFILLSLESYIITYLTDNHCLIYLAVLAYNWSTFLSLKMLKGHCFLRIL